MTIMAQARTAVQPTNRIDAIDATHRPASKPGGARDLHGASPIAYDGAPDRPAYTSEPAAISRTYYVEDKANERRYFDDYKRTALAMRATPTTISTKREDLKTIRAMLDIAQSRGWEDLRLRGTAEFRRETWIESTARGMQARGYAPTDPERQEADRRRAEQATTPAVDKEKPRPTAGAAEKKDAEPTRSEGADKREKRDDRDQRPATTVAAHSKTVRDCERELSPDGRLMLAALSEKIDRQMRRHVADTKAELKAFAATELVKKERAEGPIVLSAEQKRQSTAPPPPKPPAAAPPAPELRPRAEPATPRQSIGR